MTVSPSSVEELVEQVRLILRDRLHELEAAKAEGFSYYVQSRIDLTLGILDKIDPLCLHRTNAIQKSGRTKRRGTYKKNGRSASDGS